MPRIKLSRRTIAAIPPLDRPTIFYDTELTGFGLKVHPSGISSWIRIPTRCRRKTCCCPADGVRQI
jgi:hypothetical protein